PGPGAGLLLAYAIFGSGVAKNTAPAALIIQFFGGIHEIYFPYVLLKPLTILATLAGGMVGILTLVIFGAGLRAPAAPGSIIAVYAQTPGNSLIGVTLSVLFAAATSFIIGSIILRASRRREEEGDLAAATAQMEGLKGKESSVSGVLTPLGIQQATQNGKSILFLLEANPGPGAGLLLAYAIFGSGVAKNTAPAALIIQFFGGIHEIYFPYVLLKPLTLLATIAGGMVGIFTLVVFGAGLRAPAAPGSIIAVYAQTPGNSLVGVTLSVLFAATTSFIIGSIILRASRRRDEEGDLAAATAQMEGLKGKESSISGVLTQLEDDEAQARTERVEPIRKIVFACDAGMGSSAMGASVLRNKLKKAGFEDVSVVNVAIANLDDSYDLVVTHQDLTLRARDRTPSAQHVSVSNFMNSPKYDSIVEEVQHTNAPQDTGAPS
ncbi:MAG: hypothetical protein ACJ74K_02705, partial [Actinomycetes bacterium]